MCVSLVDSVVGRANNNSLQRRVEHARPHDRRADSLQSAAYPEITVANSSLRMQVDLVAVDDAMSRLKEHHPEKAELVKL